MEKTSVALPAALNDGQPRASSAVERLGGEAQGQHDQPAARCMRERRNQIYHEALRAAVADKKRFFMHDGVPLELRAKS